MTVDIKLTREQARLRIKDSLTRAFDELHAGEIRKNARSLMTRGT